MTKQENINDIKEFLSWYPEGKSWADIQYYLICEDGENDHSISVEELNDCLELMVIDKLIERDGDIYVLITKELKTTFTFLVNDDGPYVGAYRTGSLKNGNPTILFNMEAIFHAVKGDKEKSKTFKEALLQTATHEFCHAMQEWLGKEYDEAEVERILGLYKKEWELSAEDEAAEIEQDPTVFNVEDFLDCLDGIQPEADKTDEYKKGAEDFRKCVQDLFYPYMLHRKAAQSTDFKDDKSNSAQ